MACVSARLGLLTVSLVSGGCGGSMVEDASPGNMGGGIATVFGTGTGGLGPADTGMGGAGTAGMGSGGTGISVTDSASAADAASNSGLVPISADELSEIMADECSGMSFDTRGGDSMQVCWVPRPPNNVVCSLGSVGATPEQISFVITDRNDASALVSNTTADCPLGHGYYIDEAYDRLGLCPATCQAIADGVVKATVVVVCQPLLCIF